MSVLADCATYGELKEPEFSPSELNDSYCRGILQQHQLLSKVRVWLKKVTIKAGLHCKISISTTELYLPF